MKIEHDFLTPATAIAINFTSGESLKKRLEKAAMRLEILGESVTEAWQKKQVEEVKDAINAAVKKISEPGA